MTKYKESPTLTYMNKPPVGWVGGISYPSDEGEPAPIWKCVMVEKDMMYHRHPDYRTETVFSIGRSATLYEIVPEDEPDEGCLFTWEVRPLPGWMGWVSWDGLKVWHRCTITHDHRIYTYPRSETTIGKTNVNGDYYRGKLVFRKHKPVEGSREDFELQAKNCTDFGALYDAWFKDPEAMKVETQEQGDCHGAP